MTGPSSLGRAGIHGPVPPLADRSVALVHEWFGATGGSEQVFLSLARQLPQAQQFVLWKDPGTVVVAGPIRESWMGRTLLRRSKALALPVMPLAWRTLTRDRFDVVVSSSHAFAHTVRIPHSPETRYFSYVHSPARYIWSPELDGRGSSWALRPVRAALKLLDTRLGRHVHSYAANSVEVRARIRRCWHRDAVVINPPVDVDFYADAEPPQNLPERGYLLGAGRWISYKRFDLMIEIAGLARMPLVVAGAGPEEGRLRRLAERYGHVRFERHPDRERLRELYRGAACLLYPAHEDFGIVPVEAQACGTPVLGLARGGLLETVVHGQTGLLVDSLDPQQYARLVPMATRLVPETIRIHAKRFSAGQFHERVRHWLEAGIAGSEPD